MWVNSKVLEMLGITAETPDPPGGIIVKDPKTGEPSGLLQEMPAMSPAWELFPFPTKEQYKTSLLWIQDWLNREGITTAHDAWRHP
jgi:predicted amidohydrolase YtcJ